MAKKILVIEDETIITKSLKKLLEKNGYQVTVTNSGREAVKEAESQDFDLIVSDIRMPDLDGIETIKAIRKLRTGQNKPSVPEILITGYADEDKYKNAVELKVAAYLYKPFDTSDLLKAIEQNIK
jgi:CheY-like chemotaxis protein